MRLIGIYGASGFGREVMPLLRAELKQSSGPFELVFVDDSPGSNDVNGLPCITYAQFLERPARKKQMTLAIANSKIREELSARCKSDDVGFADVRASNVMQLDEVSIEEGAILCGFVTLTSNIRIGKHFHANIYSYVAHDCVIGDYVTFAPGVQCNGNVVIEDHAYIGTGAVLKQGRTGEPLVIGRGAVIGMGAVVTRSVPAGATVVGNPAKPMMKA